MFTNISWGSYVTIVVLLSACYYLTIGYLYYRDDLLQLVSGKKIRTNKVFAATQKYHPLLQAFSDEVQAFLHEAGRNKLDRKNIIDSLQMLLNKYPGLKNLTFQESAQDLIINECRSYCSIHLSEDELNMLWN